MAAEELLRSRRLPRWYPPAIDTCRAQPGSAAKGADEFGDAADGHAGASAARNRAAKAVVVTARQSVLSARAAPINHGRMPLCRRVAVAVENRGNLAPPRHRPQKLPAWSQISAVPRR